MLAELENISYYVQTPGHNKRFPGHNSGGINNSSSLFYYNIKFRQSRQSRKERAKLSWGMGDKRYLHTHTHIYIYIYSFIFLHLYIINTFIIFDTIERLYIYTYMHIYIYIHTRNNEKYNYKC